MLSSSKPRKIILYTIQVALTTTTMERKKEMKEIVVVVVDFDCLASLSSLIMVIMMERMMKLTSNLYLSCLVMVLSAIHWRNNRMVVRYHNQLFVLLIVLRHNNYTKRRNKNLLLILIYQLVCRTSHVLPHVISSQQIFHKLTLVNSSICKRIDATIPLNNYHHQYPGMLWM